jgi:hypothetical protein
VGVLRVWIHARRPHPLTAGHAVVGARLAIELGDIHARLVAIREHLGRHYGAPPDPAAMPPRRTERGRQEQLERALSKHHEFLRVSDFAQEVVGAIERGEDLDCGERDPLERRCGILVFQGRLAWAECGVCRRTYGPAECAGSDWDSVAGPRAGIGGHRLACPAGHTLYVLQTWVA